MTMKGTCEMLSKAHESDDMHTNAVMKLIILHTNLKWFMNKSKTPKRHKSNRECFRNPQIERKENFLLNETIHRYAYCSDWYQDRLEGWEDSSSSRVLKYRRENQSLDPRDPCKNWHAISARGGKCQGFPSVNWRDRLTEMGSLEIFRRPYHSI